VVTEPDTPKGLLVSTGKINPGSTKNFKSPVPIIEEVTKENFFQNQT
jgi:hypothetical protein